MTHPYIYQRQIERHAEDIRRAEQHRLARAAELPAADPPAPTLGTGLVRWNVWTQLFAGWPFHRLPVEPVR